MSMNKVSGGIARASGAVSRSMGPGVDVDWTYPSCYTTFFTNIMKQHGNYIRSAGAGAYTSAATTDWPTLIPAGEYVHFFIFTLAGLPGSFVRPGTYKARVSSAMASAGWTCQFIDGGGVNISSISAAGSTCTCVINDLGASGDYNNTTLNLRVFAPGTGGPWNMTPNDSTAVECYLIGNESRLNAYNADPVTNYANAFDPDVLADFASYKVLRFKDWAGTDIGFLNSVQFGSGDNLTCKVGICSTTNIMKETWRTWQMPSSNQWAVEKTSTNLYQVGGQVPYAVQAKLAKAVGATAFISLPAMYNCVSYDVVASTDTFTGNGHNFVNGDPIVLGTYDPSHSPVPNWLPVFAGAPAAMWTVYYARDVVPGVSWKLARTLGGAAIDVTADSALSQSFQQNAYRLYSHDEYMAVYTAIAQEMFAAAPGIDLILDVCNENWNLPPYGYHQFVDCISTNTVTGVGNAGSAYGWAQMRAWAAFETVYPRSQIIRMISGQGGFPGNPMHAAMYSWTDPILYKGYTVGQLVDVHCCEGYLYPNMTGKVFPPANGGNAGALFTQGRDWLDASITGTNYFIGDIVHQNDGNNYRCILGHTPTQGTNDPPNVTYWTVDSSNGLTGLVKNYTNAQWSEYMYLACQAAQYWRQTYKSTMDAYVGSRDVPLIHYECGFNIIPLSSSFFPFTDTQAAYTSFLAFVQTQEAEDAMRQFINYLKAADVKIPVYFMCSGQWRNVSGTNVCLSGLKRSHHLPDTPFAKLWKQFRP